ncbi:MAG: molybdopterin-dependent oxidoreductase [Archangium sp.]|nr:molybdopterin-dependent oxidoreductase [Archangium sp.]
MNTHYRACNLCEAICGLVIEHENGQVKSIRGDKDDPFSRGHLCPKALALGDVHHDVDRLRAPLKKVDGKFVEVSWEEAFTDIGARMRAIRRQHGADAIGFTQGNPVLHNLGASIYCQTILPWALGTRSRFSSVSVDNLPRMVVSRWMYGNQTVIAVPDLDRSQFFLVLGANPLASNGSLMTAPDLAKRLKALRARGGKLIIIDPRRTETADVADEHHFIRPGRDALFLLGIVHTLFAEGLTKPEKLAVAVRGVDTVKTLAAKWSPERVAPLTGIDAETTKRLARSLATVEGAVVYGRMGISTQAFGALATWLIDVINVLTGQLDAPGGAMFTTPAVDLVGIATRMGQPGSFDAYRSRVRALPEFNGELPIVTLAEEIETPGPGQVRALLVTAHNPVLSAPNGPRVDAALQKLELMVAVDPYLNETTRHAHYVLPPTSALEREHYDIALHAYGVRNTSRWNQPLFTPQPGALDDWQIFLRLAAETFSSSLIRSIVRTLGAIVTPRRIVDVLLRLGPHPLTVKKLEQHPHGIDLGALEPRLKTLAPKGIELAPPALISDVTRLEDHVSNARAVPPPNAVAPGGSGQLELIGRRDLRSNNSWLHNSPRLVKGPVRCTLLMHPTDASARGLENGQRVTVRAAKGTAEVPLEISDEVMPGVVSLPHGWGHDRAGIRLSVAQRHAGTSVNDVTNEDLIDALCGTAALNGVSVEVAHIASPT